MTTRTRREQRRTKALSRERIVEAAVELLDAVGERGLTFRVLTERLATGPGAIYWYVANKGELLVAATEAVVADALAEPKGSPREQTHAVALGLFAAIDAHPWLATQLLLQQSGNPGGPVTPRILESLGRRVRALGVPERHWFTATSVLMHYVLGAAAQNAANSQVTEPDANRAEFLAATAEAWEKLDPVGYETTRAMAGQMREHDDREQFLAGIDLVLAGITAQYPGSPE
ncbi:TetR/AcrR family transcriptional regulator [Amycolatopsis jejuensis]|uniref:TetR/AcrR family transcriptional regulator n=1 Tax=Amycolatopsis jejuensis TaxID=330084 RepID=UPI00052441C9|nr:TetR/AcrR family transcriptional regulator [Amycolatopsis jejuensis]